MNDLENTKAMIIDVRLNGGGYDEVGLAIANRFTDQRRQVMSKTARDYYGETKPVTADIYPEGNAPLPQTRHYYYRPEHGKRRRSIPHRYEQPS